MLPEKNDFTDKLTCLFHSRKFVFYTCFFSLLLSLVTGCMWAVELCRQEELLKFILPVFFIFPLSFIIREKLKLGIFLCVIFSAACFFVNYFEPPAIDMIRLDRATLMYCLYNILFLALYFIISGELRSDCLKNTVTFFFITALSLPLLAYFSFDLEKMVKLYHFALISGDTSAFFRENKMIQWAFAGMFIRYLILSVSVLIMLFCFPVLKFKTDKTASVFTVLIAISWIFFLTPYTPLLQNLSPPADALKFEMLFAKRKNPLADGSYEIKQNTVPGHYFLIVGESHEYDTSCRTLLEHETFFKKIRTAPGFYSFKEAFCLYGTREGYAGPSEFNVCNMLSFASQPQGYEYLLHNPDFLDVMKSCQYKINFIHNTGRWLHANRILHAFFKRADHSLITDIFSYNGKYRTLGLQVDKEIPETLKQMYSKKILGAHTSFTLIKPMGLHVYEIIVPDDFRKKYPDVTKEALGQLYYDALLSRIVSVLKSFPETQAIVYCSDHGVGMQASRITMFVYLSEALQKARPGLSRKIKALSEKKFTHIDMDKLLLEIMDISVRKNVPKSPSLHK